MKVWSPIISMWFIFKGLGFRTAKETKTAFQYAALIALSIIDSGETNKLSKAKKKTKTKTRKEKENQRINVLYSNVFFVKKKNWKEQSQFLI